MLWLSRNANSLLVFGKFDFRYECLQQCNVKEGFQKVPETFENVSKSSQNNLVCRLLRPVCIGGRFIPLPSRLSFDTSTQLTN